MLEPSTLRDSLGRIRRKFVHNLKIGASLVLLFILLDALVTPSGAKMNLLWQAGIFMGFAVVGAAVYSIYQEVRRRRSRKRLEALGIF